MRCKCLSTFLLIWTVYTLPAQVDTTEILILGTTHLAQLDGFEPNMVDPVIARLDGMGFDAVAIEKMPGELAYDIRSRKDSAYLDHGLIQVDLALADTVQQLLGVSFLEAEDRVRKLLRRDTLTDSDRAELFQYFIALTEVPSAALQLHYLQGRADAVLNSAAERFMRDTVAAEVATRNEYFTLALPVAAHAGLNTLYPIDNLQDAAILDKYFPEFQREFREIASSMEEIMALPAFRIADSLTTVGVKRGDLSELFGYLNSPRYVEQDYAAQWELWLRTDFPSGADRARYSLWEMRNLQIAANVLRLAAGHPGERIVVIIGASHKGFLEKYLRQVADIRVLSYP